MSKKLKLVIIGGVAGGASAAARARRLSEDAEIILIERGGYISFANCGLPYHIEGKIQNRKQLLVQTPEKMSARYNIDVRVQHEVLSIHPEKKSVSIKDLNEGREYEESYDYLILSPGAEPVKPPIPGINHPRVCSLRNIEDMDHILAQIKERANKNAVVIGGGYIGLEMTEALKAQGFNVILVELANQVMTPIDEEMAELLHHELLMNGIDLRLGVSVTAFSEISPTLLDVQLSDGNSIQATVVISAIGVRPEAKLAKNAGLTLGETGGIQVDSHLKTSDDAIYAVGDAIEITNFVSEKPCLIPLAGPANRQARIAIDHILGRDSIYHNTQGTGICKVFGITAGMTGLNEKLLKSFDIPYEKIYLHANDHAGYYPGATPISFKLLFDPKTGKIFGAQAVGSKGVDKRIDLVAMAIRSKLSVEALQHLELAYAPPYNSAKDILNYAGFVAMNVIDGSAKIIHSENIRDDQLILDVRTEQEFESGTIPGAISIPVDELRERLKELPKDKEIVVFCRVGLRGYIAYRILTQHGFNVFNLSGGYVSYQLANHYLVENIALPKESRNDAGEAEMRTDKKTEIALKIDARGLQCPGPIQQLKEGVEQLKEYQALEIIASDPGFVADAPAWCDATGNRLVSVEPYVEGGYRAVIEKGINPNAACAVAPDSPACQKKMTIVVFSGDLDKALAAFIIANGAAAMGYEPTLFFTFWGLNILRKDYSVKTKKNLIERMFGFMMPRGAKKLALSKMNMMGMGSAMIKGIMKKKNVDSLPELIASAQNAGVNMVACAMTMDLMGFKQEELLDGVKSGGVATFIQKAGESGITLFI